MNSLSWCRGRRPLTLLALALGIWSLSSRSDALRAAEGEPDTPVYGTGLNIHNPMGMGTLGYGGDALYPGYYGFSLSFHPGYGYGGYSLGVGACGGYPFYGGPGYPHLPPPLNRCGRILPFPFNGSSPFAFDFPSAVVNIGPLVANRPIMPGSDRPDLGSGYPHNGDFGPFTGAFPYPETFFGPYVSAAGGEARTTSPSYSPAMVSPARSGILGIDEEPMVDAGGVRRLKVSKVYPGSVAEKAGLRAGDVIHSINGYLTQEPGNLVWIISNAAPDKVLKLIVRTATDGQEHTFTVQLP